VLIDSVEQKVIEQYAVHELTPEERDALEQRLGKELATLSRRSGGRTREAPPTPASTPR
jgi:hypothetical protein